MLENVTEMLIAGAIKIIGAVIAVYLAKKLGGVLKSVEMKYDIDIDDNLERQLKNKVKTIVRAVYQSYVDGLKKTGKFNGAEKKEAMKRAIAGVKSEIAGTVLEIGDEQLTNLIEAVIIGEKERAKDRIFME